MTSCKHNCQCAARLERIETMLSQLLPKPEPSAQRLVQAIFDVTHDTPDEWFLAGVLWRMAESERVRAEVEGLEEPELSQALADHGITSAHGLSRWIAKASWAFERGAEERGGVQWTVCGFSGDETA